MAHKTKSLSITRNMSGKGAQQIETSAAEESTARKPAVRPFANDIGRGDQASRDNNATRDSGGGQ